MKLAYNGKIEHHWAQHHAQAIASLGSKRDRIGQYTKNACVQTTHHIRPSRHHTWVG